MCTPQCSFFLLHSTELAALGLNTFVFTLAFYTFGGPLGSAAAPMVAEARAAGRVQDAQALTLGGLGLAVALGLLLGAGLELGQVPVLDAMGSGALPPDVAQAAASFLRARALAAPAVLACAVATGAFRGRLDTATPLKVGLFAAAS